MSHAYEEVGEELPDGNALHATQQDVPLEAALTPLLPSMIEHAIVSGSRVRQLEQERGAAVGRARRAIEALLKNCAAASAGFRGQHIHRIDGAPAIPVTGTSKDAVYILTLTGELRNCNTSEALHKLWRALPKILDEHIEACAALVASAVAERDAMMTLTRNAEIIEALLDTTVPAGQKRELVERAFHNRDIIDALAAAEATGERGAVAKVIRDQAGVATSAIELNAADVNTFVEQYIYNAVRQQTDHTPVVITFQTTGCYNLGWTIDLVNPTPTVTVGVRSGAHCQLVIDFDVLRRILAASASQANESFMQAYFSGKLKISGDPMLLMEVAGILTSAQQRFEADQR